MYSFVGRVKKLSVERIVGSKNLKYVCSFIVEPKLPDNNSEDGTILVFEDAGKTLKLVKNSFTIKDEKIFAFISQHSKEKIRITCAKRRKIVKVELIYD